MSLLRFLALVAFAVSVVWAWTIWTVYFAGGQTIITEPGPEDGIEVIALDDNIHVIQGAGGNITVLSGDDGVLLVDTGYERMDTLVIEELREISDSSVVTIVNTHGHDDHTGGNFGFAGAASRLVAHESTLEGIRESIGADLPGREPIVVKDRHQFDFNGQTIRLIHAPRAHTAGDLLVVLEPANIVIAGDTLYTNMLPYLSRGNGATLDGHLEAQNMLVALSDTATTIVPGHGPLTDLPGVTEVNAALKRVRDRLAWMKDMGVPRRMSIFLHPLRGWPKSRQLDGDWERFWISIVWDTLP